MPRPPFLLWGSTARPPLFIRPMYKNISCNFLINITVSAQMNCMKQVTKWVAPTDQRQSKWFYCICSSFMVENCSSTSKMTPDFLSAVGNDDRMLRSKFVVVCKCPGAGTLLTTKCPAPRNSSRIIFPGFARDGDVRGWNWLAHKCGTESAEIGTSQDSSWNRIGIRRGFRAVRVNRHPPPPPPRARLLFYHQNIL